MFYIKVQIKIDVTSIQNKLRIDVLYIFLFKKVTQQYLVDFEYVLDLLDSYFRIPLDSSDGKINWYSHFLNKLSHTIKRSTNFFPYLDYCIIDKLTWLSTIGLEEADKTGFYTGSLWAMKGIFLSLLTSKVKLRDLQLNINPDFSHKVLSSQFSCILRIKIVHIIRIRISLFLARVRGYYRGKRQTKIFKSPYRRFDANSHG